MPLSAFTSLALQGIDCTLLLLHNVGELAPTPTLHCSYFSTHLHRLSPGTLWVAKLGEAFVAKWWDSYGLNGVGHL